MVDQEAMFDDQEAMLDDQEAMFDDQEAMCVLMHFMVQPSFDLGCDNSSPKSKVDVMFDCSCP